MQHPPHQVEGRLPGHAASAGPPSTSAGKYGNGAWQWGMSMGHGDGARTYPKVMPCSTSMGSTAHTDPHMGSAA